MRGIIPAAVFATAMSSPASAEVKTTSESGFNVVHITSVAATPEEIWKRLLAPKDWWNKAHSWSGSSAGFYIDAQANGCFCELFQEKGADGKIKTTGSVEHMRVIFAQPGKVLRMQGALGPLQSEAVIGTLTVAMEPAKDGKTTKVSFSYVVGGYMRYKVADIAPAVDKVLGEQFKNMVQPFTAAGGNESKDNGFSLDVDKLEDPKATDEAEAEGSPNPGPS
ncbi:MAG: hypothetical protein IBJ12_12005 [Sphingomonadaceae bacterium]|nr:hypothetical protein [Sphingomonadaceae bacterium]